MKVKQIIFMILVSLGAVNAQTTMSLKEVVNYALKGNTEIKKQNLALLVSNEKVKEMRGQGMPQVSGNVQLTDNLIIPKSVLPGEIFGQPGKEIKVAFGVQYSLPVSIRADQIIYNKFYKVGIEQAKEAVKLSEVLSDKAKQDALYQVATAYYQAIIVREQGNLIKANIEKVEQSLAAVQSQFDNQMARKIDVDQLKVLLANTQTNYENAQVNLTFSIDNLKILMGFPIEQELVLSDSSVESSQSIFENKTNNNLQISLLEKQLNLKSLEIKGIDAKYRPTIAAFTTFGSNSQFSKLSEVGWNSNALIGLQLSMPIYDGKQKFHQKQQRLIEIEALQLDQRLLTNSLNVQYKNAQNKYVQSVKNVSNQDANLKLAKSVYESIQNNYKNGLASLTDIINSDTSLKEAQNQYLTSVLQLKISLLDILYVNGNINQLLN